MSLEYKNVVFLNNCPATHNGAAHTLLKLHLCGGAAEKPLQKPRLNSSKKSRTLFHGTEKIPVARPTSGRTVWWLVVTQGSQRDTVLLNLHILF